MIQPTGAPEATVTDSPATPEQSALNNNAVDDLSVSASDGVVAKAKDSIRLLMPEADELMIAEKAEQFIDLAVTDWAQWVANEDRDSRMDDMIVGRLSDLYADIIEVVPSQDEIVKVFCLKPSLAKQVSALFTQSPKPKFRKRVLSALKDVIENAIGDSGASFMIEINKNLDDALKQEEETLHKNDPTYEHRKSGKALFGGASIMNIVFNDCDSGKKLVAHLAKQLDEIEGEPAKED